METPENNSRLSMNSGCAIACRLCKEETPVDDIDVDGLCPKCADLMKPTLHPVDCKLCGVKTPNLGTELCDFCWVTARSLERYIRVTRPEKVLEGLNSVLEPLGYKIIKGV